MKFGINNVFKNTNKSCYTNTTHIKTSCFFLDIFFYIFSKKKDLTRQEISDLRSEMIDVINEAVEKSISNTKSMIKNIVDEYSQTKEKHER